MSDYVIGDIQGCYDSLMYLLDHVQFDPHQDRLWSVGDLVNRGPHSLAVLRFFKQLPITPIITLGNHDLYLLFRLFVNQNWHGDEDDTLDEILNAPDAKNLGHWLRKQHLLYHDKAFQIVMTHAGIAPLWNLAQAKAYAHEVESCLAGDQFTDLLFHMEDVDNKVRRWSDELTGMIRLKCLINFFTRMRFCDERGDLCLSYKGTLAGAPSTLTPWYVHPLRQPISETLVFGHWSALGVTCPAPHIYALDTGCVWGNKLTTLRLQDKQLFSVRT